MWITQIQKGLLLPLRIYFHPLAVSLEYHQHTPENRKQLRMHSAIALLWLPLTTIITWLILPTDNPDMILMPPIWAGLIFLMMLGYREEIWKIFLPQFHVDFRAVMPVIAFSVFFNMAVTIIWIAVGHYGYNVTGDSIDAWDNSTFKAINNMALAIAIGIFINVLAGINSHVKRWLLIGSAGFLLYAILVVRSPAAQPEDIIAGFLALLIFNHLLFFPIYFSIALFNSLLLKLQPEYARRLWQLSPLRWDEYIFVPLPGEVALLATLYEHHPEDGKAALAYLSQNPLRQNIVRKAQKQLQQNTEQ